MRNIVVLTSFAAIHSLDNLPIDNREFIVTETLSKFPPSFSSIRAKWSKFILTYERQTIGKMDVLDIIVKKKKYFSLLFKGKFSCLSDSCRGRIRVLTHV